MLAPRKPDVVLRAATPHDVPRLVAMNHAAYPELVEENVVWSPSQIEAHLTRFPEGQIVAEVDGAPVGAISTFIVPRTRDPMVQHTWLEITDDGTFESHDPSGDTLYLADVYVDPVAWGKGVGESLYDALKQLCVACGLRRVVAGGRLWGYHEFAERMSAAEYVERALRGEIRDRVLGSQIKAGFAVRGILTGYLNDPRSRNYATLLEWTRDSAPDGRMATGSLRTSP
jgi:ribosomal protein S18 acetylase RimI-like enzyme